VTLKPSGQMTTSGFWNALDTKTGAIPWQTADTLSFILSIDASEMGRRFGQINLVMAYSVVNHEFSPIVRAARFHGRKIAESICGINYKRAFVVYAPLEISLCDREKPQRIACGRLPSASRSFWFFLNIRPLLG
jgi:hypothetical protein